MTNEMESLEQKKRRLFGKQYLPKYLEELERLLVIDVKKEDILSIIETDYFINITSCNLKGKKPAYKKTILFSDKEKLKEIIEREVLIMDAPYLMYLSYSLDCGLMKIPNLYCFNLNFSFYDEHAGIIEFTRDDGKESILLDFYEEKDKQFLDIEIFR